ncbi:deoxyribodipyrimidine photo-lyase, partial [Streptomyces sp. NPDC005143]
MTVSVALFTSDLRLHDNPVLSAAVRGADAVVPLFASACAVAVPPNSPTRGIVSSKKS